MREELIREILDKALTEELGLVVICDNQHGTEIKIHEVRKKDAAKYAELMVCLGSKPDEILITKRTVELDDAREPSDES